MTGDQGDPRCLAGWRSGKARRFKIMPGNVRPFGLQQIVLSFIRKGTYLYIYIYVYVYMHTLYIFVYLFTCVSNSFIFTIIFFTFSVFCLLWDMMDMWNQQYCVWVCPKIGGFTWFYPIKRQLFVRKTMVSHWILGYLDPDFGTTSSSLQRVDHPQTTRLEVKFTKWDTGRKYGGFPEMGVPPVIIHFRLGFSLINHPAIGVPLFQETPMY